MRPDLLRLQLMQQMMQQQQHPQQAPQGMPTPAPQMPANQPQMGAQPAPDNPVAKGAFTGIEAAKRSLQMNESENKRALGRAMMHFFSGQSVPEPGSGAAGALGSINASFLPALHAYDAERDRIAQQNFTLMRHEEEMRRHAAKEAQEAAHLEELKRMHDAQIEHYGAQNEHYRTHDARLSKEEREYERSLQIKDSLMQEGVLPQNATMFGEIPDTNQRKLKQKEMHDSKERLAPAVKNLQNIKLLEKIMEDHPNLWKSSGRFIESVINKNDAQYKSFLAGLADEADIAAAQMIRKITNDYISNAIKTFPGRSTDITKKIIANTMINATTSPIAAKQIMDSLYKENLRIAKNAKLAADGWKHGYYVPEDSEEMEEYLSNLDSKPVTPQQDAGSPFASMSKEELLEQIRKRKLQQGINQ